MGRTKIREGIELSDLIGFQCQDCVKKNIDRQGYFYCLVFKEFYFQDHKSPPHCYAFSDDLMGWIKTLKLIQEGMRLSRNYEYYHKVSSEINYAEAQIGEKSEGWEGVYYKEMHKPGIHGGGEKADRTNKLFGPSRMRDNSKLPGYTIQDVLDEIPTGKKGKGPST